MDLETIAELERQMAEGAGKPENVHQSAVFDEDDDDEEMMLMQQMCPSADMGIIPPSEPLSSRSRKRLHFQSPNSSNASPAPSPAPDKRARTVDMNMASSETTPRFSSRAPTFEPVEKSWFIITKIPKRGLYMEITSPDDGSGDSQRLYLERQTEATRNRTLSKLVNKTRGAPGRLLDAPIGNLLSIIENERLEQAVQQSSREAGIDMDDARQSDDEDAAVHVDQHPAESQLWVDKYSPRNFMDLLSDQRMNREVFQWVHAWDPVVFGTTPPKLPEESPLKPEFFSPGRGKQKFQKKSRFLPDNPSLKRAPNQRKDDYRPYPRVLLFAGDPGTGKTTLAHVVAKACGYNVVEINASDDRTASRLRQRIRDATEMQSVFGSRLPNLVVIDEIDGAMGSEQNDAVRELIKLINIEAKGKELRRPIICICNDQYVRSLRPLREHALIYRFAPPTQLSLATRLRQICSQEHVHINRSALTALCSRSQSDIRSALHSLQLLRRQRRHISLNDVLALPSADVCKDRFDVWRSVLRRNGKRKQGDSQAASFDEILSIVSAHHEPEPIVDGLFENYLAMPYSDPTFSKTCDASEWMSFGDLVHQKIISKQMFLLSGYISFVCMSIHHNSAVRDVPKLEMPKARFQHQKGLTRNRSIVDQFVYGSKCKFTHSQAIQDVIPLLLTTLTPKIRPVSFHLMSSSEQKVVKSLIDSMLLCGLSYVSDPKANGVRLTPDIALVTTFSERTNRPMLPRDFCESLAHEIRLQRIRRNAQAAVDKAPPARQIESTETKSKAVLENNENQAPKQPQQEDSCVEMEKPAAPKGMSESWKACFSTRRANEKMKKMKHKIHYRHHEGVTNAVRRVTYMRDFM